jgi:hypothetical protein
MFVIRICHFVIVAAREHGTLAVMMVLVLIPIAALASPPDPTWIEGIYDGNDADALVTLATEMAASTDCVATDRIFGTTSSGVGVLCGVGFSAGSNAVPPARSPPRTITQLSVFIRGARLFDRRSFPRPLLFGHSLHLRRSDSVPSDVLVARIGRKRANGPLGPLPTLRLQDERPTAPSLRSMDPRARFHAR